MPPEFSDVAAATTPSWTAILVGLTGGLALFLYGIETLSEGLRAVAGDGLKRLLSSLTSNRFTGLLTGMLVTALVQSSSLTTVLVVGFVSAGLMSLQQAIGVIFGANIGTTLTLQLAAFHITDSAWGLVAVGFSFFLLGKRDWARQLGSVLIGLGLLFLALSQMSKATLPLRTYEPFLNLMQQLENPLFGILVGMLVTALIQSSSAMTGMLLALASQGAMSLPAALAMVLGANLGSCVTAVLASLGKPAEARQAAVIHVLFNSIGVIAWFPFLSVLEDVTRALSDDLPRQIAHAHTLFNVTNAIFLIGFVGPMAKAARWIVPDAPATTLPPPPGTPRFLDPGMIETPSLALDRVRLELQHTGELVLANFDQAIAVTLSGTREQIQAVVARDQDVNQLHREIIDYARRVARRELTTIETSRLNDCLAAAGHLESIGDVAGTDLTTQGLRRLEHALSISPTTHEAILRLHRHTRDDLKLALDGFLGENHDAAMQVVQGKLAYNAHVQETLDLLRRRLVTDEPERIRTFQMEVDLVSQLQRIHYLARRIAKLTLPTQQQGTN